MRLKIVMGLGLLAAVLFGVALCQLNRAAHRLIEVNAAPAPSQDGELIRWWATGADVKPGRVTYVFAIETEGGRFRHAEQVIVDEDVSTRRVSEDSNHLPPEYSEARGFLVLSPDRVVDGGSGDPVHRREWARIRSKP